MFPTELMSIKKTKSGQVFPVYITNEQMDYCRQVNAVFRSDIGKTLGEIEKEIKDLESRSEKHKIIRALGTIMFRKSIFTPPSTVSAPEIRDFLFTKAKFPAYTQEDRTGIIQEAAEHFGVPNDEILSGMYGDKETEQVLESVYNVSDEDLAKEFNLETLETLLSKYTEIKVRGELKWQEISTRARLHGILLKMDFDGVTVKEASIIPPLMGKGRTSGNISGLLDIIRAIISSSVWSLEAKLLIENKTWGRKDSLNLRLDQASSFYLPRDIQASNMGIPSWLKRSDKPLVIDQETFFPCFEVEISGKTILIFVSAGQYLSSDIEMCELLEKAAIPYAIASVNATGKEHRKNWYYFRGSIDWDTLRNSISKQGKDRNLISERKKSAKLENELDRDLIDEVRRNVEKLYPNSDRMIDYIESKGLIASRVLPALGYKIKWNGLDMVVTR